MSCKSSRFLTRKLFLVFVLAITGYITVRLFASSAPSNQVDIPSGSVDSQQMPPSDTFGWITSSGWRFLNAHGTFSEGYEYHFSRDGAFTWTIISDHSESQKGVWNYKEISGNDGLLFLLGQSDQGDVLHYSFADRTHLRLAGDVLTPMDNNTSTSSPPPSSTSKATLQDIVTPQHF